MTTEETTPSIQEDVNQTWQDTTWENEQSESHQTKDYAEEARNKAIALKQEREKARQIESELAEYKRKEKELQEQEMQKKWEYEQLIQAKNQELEEAKNQLSSLSAIKEKFETTMKTKLDELTKKVPESQKSFIEKMTNGKSVDEQLELVEEYVKTIWTTYDSKTWSQWKWKTWDAYSQAVSSKDISWMIANAPSL